MFLRAGHEEHPGVFGVADRGLGIEAEHGSQVQWVRAVREGFLELPVDAQPFQGRGLATEFFVPPQSGDGTGAYCAALMIRCGLVVLGQRVRR